MFVVIYFVTKQLYIAEHWMAVTKKLNKAERTYDFPWKDTKLRHIIRDMRLGAVCYSIEMCNMIFGLILCEALNSTVMEFFYHRMDITKSLKRL